MKYIPQGLTRKIGREILTMKKNSPRLLFIAGIAGIVSTTIVACKATLKLEKTLDEFKEDVDGIQSIAQVRSSSDSRKDMVYAYAKGTSSLLRLYGPTIVLGSASIAALTTSHVTLTRRNVSLMAAYSTVSASFEAYRERVRAEIGVDKELDIRHAITTENMMVDQKTQAVRMADPGKWSPYARFFDESSSSWQKSPEHNKLFIICQQNYANDLLRSRGHVFLNEVYDMLGLERSQAGQVVGWVIGHGGDEYVDFGVFEISNASFVNGYERTVLLDFNVDGTVYDLI